MEDLVFNKDIMDWNKFPIYDIIWCDPPWEQRMVKFFETMMEKSGQKRPNNSIEAIIQKLAVLADTSKPVFIEYSTKGYQLVIDLMQMNGHKCTRKIESKQENGNPYMILAFNTEVFPDGSFAWFSIIDDLCEKFDFKIVFDPFAGIGKTAKKFIQNNKTYKGSEINSERFEKLKKVVWAEQQ